MSVTIEESEEQDHPQPVRPRGWARLRAAWRRAGDQGAAAAEYAVVMMAGCAFAGLLLALLNSGQVRTALANLIKRALSVA
jgi:hypothetical protein